ncbi:hypothetical protein RP20_CCG006929 [Aedes albopictus]|nr:trypsin alpha-3-like [Aedes albopictus]KXJ67979.1 hypothetical protein RP20_CCG006929 [Aedes albopictus]
MWFPAKITPLVTSLLIVVSCATDTNDVKIIGGFPAELSSTYHQVSIRRKSVDLALFGSGHICGGSLINDWTVLTAAHCLVNQDDKRRVASFFRVVGGGLDRTVENQDKMVANVSKVIIHEEYNAKTFANDIGLLILDKAIEDSHPTLKTIDLATKSPAPGTACQTTGWGTTQFGVPMATVELRAVNITVQTTESCNATYAGMILDGMLCVGEIAGGKDTCQGDSGGPLVCNGSLAGVVSFGDGCGSPNFVGVYSDVVYFREWINKHKSGGEKLVSAVFGLVVAGALHMFRAVREM